MEAFKIGDRILGEGEPVLIVAELSGNHLQDFDLAVSTVKKMKSAGADAVKLQTYTADTMTLESPKEFFKIQHGTLWDGKTLHSLYHEAHTPWEWQPKIKKLAEKLGLIFFSSPFDSSAVDFLETMEVPAYKVASFEITDIPLIELIASKGKPVFISTGIAEGDEIQEAVNACRRIGNDQIILLKCTSAYPSPIEELNLRTIPDLETRFGVMAGLSDHSLGVSVPAASVALGAKTIEKHFILDRKLGGPDAAFSLEPAEFRRMVDSVREVEKALGKINYELTDHAKKSRIFTRSLFVVEDMKAGESFTDKKIKSIRPFHGLPPKCLPELLHRRARRSIKKGTPLKWELIQ